MILSNHSFIHHFFTYRSLGIFCWNCLLIVSMFTNKTFLLNDSENNKKSYRLAPLCRQKCNDKRSVLYKTKQNSVGKSFLGQQSPPCITRYIVPVWWTMLLMLFLASWNCQCLRVYSGTGGPSSSQMIPLIWSCPMINSPVPENQTRFVFGRLSSPTYGTDTGINP